MAPRLIEQHIPVELACSLVNILHWHVSLVENNVSSDVGRLHSHDFTDVLQDHQAVRKVLPEKSCIDIKSNQLLPGRNLAQVLSLDRDHGEGDSTVAYVGVEHGLEVGLVRDLPLVHRADPLLDGKHLHQVQVREAVAQCPLDILDLAVEQLDLKGTLVVQVLVEEGHILLPDDLVTLLGELAKEADDSSGVDDLVAGAEGEVQEGGDGDAGQEEALAEGVAGVVHAVNGVGGGVEAALGTNDINVLAVVDDLADEGHIL
eukprot:CAMPEP_0168613606 /NCGR_PEP_ID=MMETSP0449_2-20121227/3538_1 /TAXON_ID=1082188 /ORGANISM="Strombidium rassoulzadegani, Strain ras09" /LENGTH=259 /DNA_ID=CAMNT_0008654245 /DNA_START=163 /DNA_END=943 /DNA_ORIENTATION=-